MTEGDSANDGIFSGLPTHHSVTPRAAVRLVESEGGRISLSTLQGWISRGLLPTYTDAAGIAHVDIRDVRRIADERKGRGPGRPPKTGG